MLFASRSERAEEIRGLINAGNHRGAKAVRGGKDGEPRFYDVFGPKVLAGIDAGRLPDTIADRAIHVLMQRKSRGRRVERVRRRLLVAEVEGLRDRLYAWAHKHVDQLADYDVPVGDLDRAQRPRRGRLGAVAGIAALAGEDTYAALWRPRSRWPSTRRRPPRTPRMICWRRYATSSATTRRS